MTDRNPQKPAQPPAPPHPVILDPTQLDQVIAN